MMRYGKDDPTDMDSLENTRRATEDAVRREVEEDFIRGKIYDMLDADVSISHAHQNNVYRKR